MMQVVLVPEFYFGPLRQIQLSLKMLEENVAHQQ
jgi:hypothetical protein